MLYAINYYWPLLPAAVPFYKYELCHAIFHCTNRKVNLTAKDVSQNVLTLYIRNTLTFHSLVIWSRHCTDLITLRLPVVIHKASCISTGMAFARNVQFYFIASVHGTQGRRKLFLVGGQLDFEEDIIEFWQLKKTALSHVERFWGPHRPDANSATRRNFSVF